MTAVAETLRTLSEAITHAMAGPIAWARGVAIDVWIASTFALLVLIAIWALLSLKRSIKRADNKAPTPSEVTETTIVEAQAALLQALDANEYQKEQIEAITRDLADWSATLNAEPPDASMERSLSTIRQTLTKAHAQVAELHQQAKSKQINTLNQTLVEDAGPVLDSASRAMIETMADWLSHHQALYDRLDELSTSLQAIKAHHDSPGSVRHGPALKRIDDLSRTLTGLERSLETLGQDLHRVQQLMLGAR